MIELALFDLDGCVSNDRWRRHHQPTGKTAPPEAYDSYNIGCAYDEPANVQCVIEEMAQQRLITFVTARPEKWRPQTHSWLDKHFSGWHTLLMRPDGNVARSPQLKEQLILEHLAATKAKVAVAYDDRDDVIAMYRALGFDARLLEI